MKLEFKINESYLAAIAIHKSKMFDYLAEKHIKAFLKLKTNRRLVDRISANEDVNKLRIDNDIRNLIEEIRKSKKFANLSKKTRKHLKYIKNQWNKNKRKCLNWIEELSGIKLPKKTIPVYITYPVSCGVYRINPSRIGWGTRERWKNYTSVYLCHELMHFLTEKHGGQVMHTLIELATDNEIRIRLNGGKYSTKIGHKQNQWVMKMIRKRWGDYIQNKKGRNIVDLAKEIEGSQL